MTERLRILSATVQTPDGPVVLRRGDPVPTDLEPGERERLAWAFEIVPDQAALDCFTAQPHYFDHVAPLAASLGLTVQLMGQAARKSYPGLRTALCGSQRPSRTHEAALVMGPGDIRLAVRLGWKRIAYLAHGIGQDYERLLASAAPGENIPWDRVDVVLLPSGYAAARFEPLCPQAEKLVVGQPKMDELLAIRPPLERSDAAISFRWRHQRAPEASGAFDHYREGLAEVARYLDRHMIRLLGHGHPRIFPELAPIYQAAGIEPVVEFAEVVRRARVLAFDNSSVGFEFAALDRPVVVMNAPWYRRDVHHGGRFWEWADVGEQVGGPDELGPAIIRAFEHDLTERQAPQIERRREIVCEVLPLTDGRATERAAEALRERFPAEVGVPLPG